METRRILEENLRGVLHNIREAAQRCHRDPEKIELVIATKDQPIETISIVKSMGYIDFGESYVKEFLSKVDRIPGVNWHFIGRFHPKKAGEIVGNTKYIHSIPSMKHLRKVDHEAKSKGIVQNVLLQVNVSGERTKQGFSPNGLLSLCENHRFSHFPYISFEGLMTIAPKTSDRTTIGRCFGDLRKLRDRINETGNDFHLRELSMGMSNDYTIAVQEGATILRIGSAIFRNI